MYVKYCTIVLYYFFVCIGEVKGQLDNYERDSILGDHYYTVADSLWRNVDSCLYYSQLALPCNSPLNNPTRLRKIFCNYVNENH